MSTRNHQGGKRIFVSFEYRRDNDRAQKLMSQARGRGYPAPVFDLSLKERYTQSNTEWVSKARSRILGCQLVVVVLGQDTHNATGVKREIQLAKELGKQIIQVRQKGATWSQHSLLKDRSLVDWDWEELDKYFDSNYGNH